MQTVELLTLGKARVASETLSKAHALLKQTSFIHGAKQQQEEFSKKKLSASFFKDFCKLMECHDARQALMAHMSTTSPERTLLCILVDYEKPMAAYNVLSFVLVWDTGELSYCACFSDERFVDKDKNPLGLFIDEPVPCGSVDDIHKGGDFWHRCVVLEECILGIQRFEESVTKARRLRRVVESLV